MDSCYRQTRSVKKVKNVLNPASVITAKDPNRTIVTDSTIVPGTKFGPFPGKDAVQVKFSNWMQFVPRVQSLDDSNMVIFICKKQLYFYCIRTIHPGMEFFVWGGTNEKSLLESERLQYESQPNFVFECQDCDSIFTSHRGLYTHWANLHRPAENRIPRKKCKCPYCPRIIADRRNLRGHILLHSGIKPEYCKNRKKKVVSKLPSRAVKKTKDIQTPKLRQKLTQRADEKSTMKPDKIEVAEEKSTKKQDKNEAVEEKSTKKPDKIEVVEEKSIKKTDKNEVVNSEKKLLKDRPEKCKYCDKRFIRKGHLAIHVRFRHELQTTIKTKIKQPLMCTLCLKSFSCRSVLLKHQREVHLTKPAFYKCPICHKKFENAMSRYKHLKRTHAFRNYWCSECHRQFNRKDNIVVHIGLKHNGNGTLLTQSPKTAKK